MSLGLITPGALLVGIDASPPPPLHMGDPDSPDFSGFEVDLMTAIAGDLGLAVRHRSVLWRDMNEDTYAAVASGEVDAAVDDSPIAAWFVRHRSDLAVVSLIPGTDAQYALMLAQDKRALRTALDAALARIRGDGRYAAVQPSLVWREESRPDELFARLK